MGADHHVARPLLIILIWPPESVIYQAQSIELSHQCSNLQSWFLSLVCDNLLLLLYHKSVAIIFLAFWHTADFSGVTYFLILMKRKMPFPLFLCVVSWKSIKVYLSCLLIRLFPSQSFNSYCIDYLRPVFIHLLTFQIQLWIYHDFHSFLLFFPHYDIYTL